MSEPELTLASEFPGCTEAQWQELVSKALGGGDVAKLIQTNLDGIPIRPLYHAPGAVPSEYPGEGSLVRGTSPRVGASSEDGGGVSPGWRIRQKSSQPDPRALNRELLDDLERGASAIEICLDIAARMEKGALSADSSIGVDGAAIHSLADLERALEGVRTDLCEVVLDGGADFLCSSALLLALVAARGDDASALHLDLAADPLGQLSATGQLKTSVAQSLAELAELGAHVSVSLPRSRAVRVSTACYVNAGATEAQELGAAVSTGIAYVRAMTEAGMSVQAAFDQVGFELSTAPDQLLTIAKLRAFRQLWSRVANLSGADVAAGLSLSAHLTECYLTQRDPWVNMLRATVACFGAAIGGCDAISLPAFSAAIGLPDDFARRVARNTHVVLQEESHLGRVADPAGGSYALEALTGELAQRGWKQMQRLEAAGGLAQDEARQLLRLEIDQAHLARRQAINKRKQPLTGVSEFPKLDEEAVTVGQPNLAALRESILSRATEPVAANTHGAEAGLKDLIQLAQAGASLQTLRGLRSGDAAAAPAFPLRRLAAPFEHLRDESDAILASSGGRPFASLICLGSVAEHTARASFAKNLLEAGGIEARVSSPIMSPEQVRTAVDESGTKLAVVCSTDAIYSEQLAAIASELKAAGVERIVLAGHPKAQVRDYTADGVNHFIFMGCDAHGVLSELMSLWSPHVVPQEAAR